MQFRSCRYLLRALDLYWHEDCLKCGCCDCRLSENGSTLYTKANLVLCRRDYLRFVLDKAECPPRLKVIIHHLDRPFSVLIYFVGNIAVDVDYQKEGVYIFDIQLVTLERRPTASLSVAFRDGGWNGRSRLSGSCRKGRLIGTTSASMPINIRFNCLFSLSFSFFQDYSERLGIVPRAEKSFRHSKW